MTSFGVTLITPTGGRQKAFDRCQRYMERIARVFFEPVQWIVVDDGYPRTEIRKIIPWTQTVIRREPRWRVGENTLALNLLAALPKVEHDKILFIEDDDWYASDYVKIATDALVIEPMVGEARSRYFHLPSRRYRVFDNATHASLCQTGIRRELLPRLEKICRASSEMIDVRLWQFERVRESAFRSTAGCVGIKGLPGRAGIGIGHRPENDGAWTRDANAVMLKLWIGSDASLYEEFL